MIKKTWSVKTDENTVTFLPSKQVMVRMCDYGKTTTASVQTYLPKISQQSYDTTLFTTLSVTIIA